MPFTMVLIENPRSILGDKKGNHREFKPPAEKKPNKGAVLEKARDHEARTVLADKNEEDLEDPSRLKEVAYIKELVAVKSGKFFWASTGSLNTMMAELAGRAKKQDDKCDRIIFIGHGNAGSMSTGAGRLGEFPSLEDLPEDATKKQRDRLERYEQDKRMIALSNENYWASLFSNAQEHLTERNGALKIYLLGCKTAKPFAGIALHQKVASRLGRDSGMSVKAYATRRSIKVDQIREIIDGLDAIESQASPGAPYVLKSCGKQGTVECAHS